MGAISAKIAGSSGGAPPSGSVPLSALAPLAAFSVIGNETASSATPTAVSMMGVPGQTSTATAAGTTTLTNVSKGQQIFTGATTQTVVLPVVSALPVLGFGYWIINNSSDALTVNSSGSNLVLTIAAGARALVFCKLLTGTSAASWDYVYVPVIVPGITNSAPANTLTKSDGTNLVASTITDDGTNVVIAAPSGALDLTADGNISFSAGGNVTISGGVFTSPFLTSASLDGNAPALDRTLTPGATTGAQTINKMAGSVNFAGAAASLVVTSDKCFDNSLIYCQVMTNDTTMKSVVAVAATGSFTLFPNAVPTAETKVAFWITN